MAAIIKKAPLQVIQTKVGYTPILRGDDFGSRTFDEDNSPYLFETKEACEAAYRVGEDACIAIATVTWEETA
jgi:hypothetical protein